MPSDHPGLHATCQICQIYNEWNKLIVSPPLPRQCGKAATSEKNEVQALFHVHAMRACSLRFRVKLCKLTELMVSMFCMTFHVISEVETVVAPEVIQKF